MQAMPNPFTNELTVAFALEAPARTRLVLVDLTGRFVFMMERKKEADYLEAGLFFNLDVSLAMDTFHLY